MRAFDVGEQPTTIRPSYGLGAWTIDGTILAVVKEAQQEERDPRALIHEPEERKRRDDHEPCREWRSSFKQREL